MEKTGNRKWSFPKFNVLLWYSTKAVGSSWVTASREKHAFLAQDIGVGDPSSWERPWPLPPKTSYHAAMGSTESSELKPVQPWQVRRVLSWKWLVFASRELSWSTDDGSWNLPSALNGKDTAGFLHPSARKPGDRAVSSSFRGACCVIPGSNGY